MGCRSPPREGPAHSCRWGGPARRDSAAPRTSAAGSLCARPGSHRPERRPRAARRRGRSKVGPSPTPFTWAAVRLTGPTVRELPSRGRRPEVTRGPQHKKLGTRPPRTPTLIGNDRQTSGRNPEISEPSVPSPPEAGRTGRQQVGGPAGRSPCPAPPGPGAVCRGALRTARGWGPSPRTRPTGRFGSPTPEDALTRSFRGASLVPFSPKCSSLRWKLGEPPAPGSGRRQTETGPTPGLPAGRAHRLRGCRSAVSAAAWFLRHRKETGFGGPHFSSVPHPRTSALGRGCRKPENPTARMNHSCPMGPDPEPVSVTATWPLGTPNPSSDQERGAALPVLVTEFTVGATGVPASAFLALPWPPAWDNGPRAPGE